MYSQSKLKHANLLAGFLLVSRKGSVTLRLANTVQETTFAACFFIG